MINVRFQHVLFFLCAALIMIASSGCFLKKNKNKSSSFTSNIVTKYNILYNSNYLLNQAHRNIQKSEDENYQEPLGVFHFISENSLIQNKALSDSIIGKLNRIINEKQNSKYVNEAFLLKGKAFFFQGDYFNANEFTKYAYEDSLSNQKIKAEAKIWQVRSLLQLDNLNEAKKSLEQARSIPIEKDQIKSLFFAIEALYLLRDNNKHGAIKSLQKAIKFSKSKKDRIRWHYLLGQLFFENGQNELAYSHFNKVSKSNESYEMIFYANLYSLEISNKKDPSLENRVMLLQKLLRDGKNKDLKGQIHQRIGDTYLAENQKEETIKHYKLASVNTINNPFQEAINYEKLADVYFNDAQYTTASFYYDSILMVLPKSNPSYEMLDRKRTYLDSLVKHLKTIELQDSLIHFTKLDAAEQRSFIDKAVNEYYQPIKVTKKKSASTNIPSINRAEYTIGNPNSSNNEFYFSSQTAISQGLSDFKKRWGNRASNGYWRYSSQSDPFINSESKNKNTITESYESRESYAESLHMRYSQLLLDTPEKTEEAVEKIKNASLRLAEIYQNNLNDNKTAIETYEHYLNRFPNDKNTAMIFFHLHRLYSNRSTKDAIHYKNSLLSDFPNSVYSLVLNDPDYYKNQHDVLARFNEEYERAFYLFQNRKYNQFFSHTAKINNDKNFTQLQNNLAQLDYLNALAIGRTTNLQKFELALREITERYATDEIVVPLVNQHLSYINANRSQFANRSPVLDEPNNNRTSFEKEFVITPWPELTINKDYASPQNRKDYIVNKVKPTINTTTSVQKTSIPLIKKITPGTTSNIRHENSYKGLKLFPDTGKYVFVINVMHESVNLSPSRYGIGQFNRSHYRKANITHQLKTVANKSQLVYIGPFDSYDEVKAYENKIKPLLINILKIPQDIYNSFIVTEEILSTFATSDQVDDYNIIYQTQP